MLKLATDAIKINKTVEIHTKVPVYKLVELIEIKSLPFKKHVVVFYCCINKQSHILNEKLPLDDHIVDELYFADLVQMDVVEKQLLRQKHNLRKRNNYSPILRFPKSFVTATGPLVEEIVLRTECGFVFLIVPIITKYD